MKIVADANIQALACFAQHGDVLAIPGEEIDADVVKDADILLTRTITTVDKALLINSAVRFVGSMTAGTDHINESDLHDLGIAWASAKGANAAAVADYVIACLALLQQDGYLPSTSLRVGVIGVGACGGRVAQQLTHLGMDVVCYDPPREQHDPHFQSVDISDLYDCHLICCHTPLTMTGHFPTYHLINAAFLAQSRHDMVLLNVGRGAVMDEQALALAQQRYCLDVWRNEPIINMQLAEQALIATPHIAGYSALAKSRLTAWVYERAAHYFGWSESAFELESWPQHKIVMRDHEQWQTLILRLYNPRADHQRLLTALSQSHSDHECAQAFRSLRRGYDLRAEFSQFALANELRTADQKKIARLLV